VLPSGTFNTKLEKDIAIFRTKTQWFLLFLLFVFLFTIPLYVSDYWLTKFIYFGVSTIAVLGLHVLTGLCGLFSIGQAAFMAVGAYTAGVFATNLGLPGLATLPLAGIMAGLVGIIFGAPSIRIKGFYLAMATLAAQFMIIWFISKIDWWGGTMGLSLETIKIGSLNSRDEGTFYCFVMIMLIIMTFFAKNLQRTKTGRTLIAIRDNELAAEVMGINLFRYKLIAFFIGCFFAGIAGWLWAYSQMRINPAQFALSDSIWFLGMLVVGGLGSTTGALLGAGGITALDESVRFAGRKLSDSFPALGSQFIHGASLSVFAIVVILFMILEPRGIYHRWESIKTSYRLYPYAY